MEKVEEICGEKHSSRGRTARGFVSGRELGPKTLPYDLSDVWILDAPFSVVRFNYLVFPRHGGC